jgi:dTDP-3,4-didehydro-2,6-dideoxy-alpha-D-glucose 3-reductase
LLDAGAYTLKALDYILGGDFSVKSSVLRYDAQHNVDLGGGIMLADSNNVIAELAFGFDNFYQCNYEIWGSKGKLTVQRAFTAPNDFTPNVCFETHGESSQLQLPADDHFYNMLTVFANSLDNNDFEPEYIASLRQAELLQQTRGLSNNE